MHEEELKQPTTVFAAVAGSLEQNLPEHLKNDAREHLTTVYGCAVAHALRDLELISGQGSFDEEDRTASLIGHLGSHLSWYLAMSDLSGLKCEQPSVSWAYQSTKAEAEKGGDFGLAVRLNDDKYNLAFFQAKLADFNSEMAANLWRPPYGYKSVSEKVTQAQADSAAAAANEELFNAIHGYRLSAQSGQGQHQFVKLTLHADKAKKTTGLDSDWIHYVLWPKNQSAAPVAFDLPRLQKILRVPTAVSKGSLKVSAADCKDAGTFLALLMRGSQAGSRGWLTVSKQKAKELVGDLSELCTKWVIVEDRGSSGGLANALKGQDAEVIEKYPPLEEIQPLKLQSTPNPTLNSIFELK